MPSGRGVFGIQIAALILLSIAGLAYTATVDIVWALLFAGLGLLYGSASALASARGLQYLVAVAPHAALMAAGIAPLLLGLAGLGASGSSLTLVTLLVGVPTVAISAYLAGRSRSRDEVVSGFLAVSVTVAIVGIHVAARLGYWAPVSALIAGDPLLAGGLEALVVALIGVVAGVYAATSIVIHVYQRVDPDDARLSGARTYIHDAAVIAVIAVVTVGLVWITGFIIQHVLLLLPAIAASRLAGSARHAVVASIAVAAAASTAGTAAAIAVDVPPAAGIGLVLLLLTGAALAARRR